MSVDLEFNDAQCAIADAVRQFCVAECDDDFVRANADRFPRALWRELAGLGVLEAGRPDDDAGAIEVCAVMEALGAAAFPGPLAASYLARRVLPVVEREAIARGEAVVCFAAGSLAPFGAEADVFIQLRGDALHRATPSGPVEALSTLGGEPWGRVELVLGPALPDAAAGLALYEVARAAYLAATGARLIADASEHARSRKQFGRAIGDFQGVAHPLADCHMRLTAARTLARAAAWRLARWDGLEASGSGPGNGRAEVGAHAARAALCAKGAALDAAHTAHQVFGAIGITLEGPAFHLSRRIRQLVSEAPSSDAARASLLAAIGLDGAVQSQ